MQDATRYKLIFNGAGALIALAVGGYFVSTVLFPEGSQTCAETYSVATPLSFETTTGGMMSAIELEARIGGREISVADFSKVVPGGQSDMPAVLEVSLPKGSLTPVARSNMAGGIGFDWQPNGLGTAKSACLSYQVFLPDDFDFKRGGTLPGFYGMDSAEQSGKPAFTTHVMWRERGEGEVTAVLPNGKEKRPLSLDRGNFKLAKGAWVRIDQEIVLNTPGKRDGQLRVWVDGKLSVKQTKVAFRDTKDTSLTGARVDVHYGGSDASFASPKDTHIRLSPPVMRTN